MICNIKVLLLEKMDQDETIFEAYMKESGIIFKNIIELLHQISPIRNQNIKQINIRITKDALHISNDTTLNSVVINCTLNADQFCNYMYSYDFPELNIGITLDILKKRFKTANKYEGISIRITKSTSQLIPDTIRFSRSCNMTDANSANKGFNIKFNIKQNISINSDTKGVKLIDLSNVRFLELCKETGGAKQIINVVYNSKSLTFSNDMYKISDNWISYPLDMSDEPEDETDESEPIFTFAFKSEYIKIISKMASLCKMITLLYDENSLIFKGNIFKNRFIKPQHGHINIGTMTIWIKPQ